MCHQRVDDGVHAAVVGLKHTGMHEKGLDGFRRVYSACLRHFGVAH